MAGEKQPRNVHDNTKMLSKSLEDLEAFGRTQTTLAGSEASPRVTETLLQEQASGCCRAYKADGKKGTGLIVAAGMLKANHQRLEDYTRE